MPSGIDVSRLIAEVQKRPQLWDTQVGDYKDRTSTPQMWQQISDEIGVNVELCKRKWKNLRDAYRAEVRRSERRTEQLKDINRQLDSSDGIGDNNEHIVHSKWVFFGPMSFIDQNRSLRRRSPSATQAETGSVMATTNTPTTPVTAAAAATSPNANIKTPATRFNESSNYFDANMEYDLKNRADGVNRNGVVVVDDDEMLDNEDEDDRLFEQFKSVATPQAARRLSNTITMAVSDSIPDATVTASQHLNGVGVGIDVDGDANTFGADDAKSSATRADDQVHFLETLEREEQKLMQSTRNDINRADSLGHIGDSDYNFLVSFLPPMKRMSEYQNLQFRARMSELLLGIMTPREHAHSHHLPHHHHNVQHQQHHIQPQRTQYHYHQYQQQQNKKAQQQFSQPSVQPMLTNNSTTLQQLQQLPTAPMIVASTVLVPATSTTGCSSTMDSGGSGSSVGSSGSGRPALTSSPMTRLATKTRSQTAAAAAAAALAAAANANAANSYDSPDGSVMPPYNAPTTPVVRKYRSPINQGGSLLQISSSTKPTTSPTEYFDWDMLGNQGNAEMPATADISGRVTRMSAGKI